ncbi:MAG: transposase, partial [Solirubrobacterales bacterium]|nr:transposase [Solirubrobacterales bacterium]
ADAGYWSNEHIDRLRERGITPLVAADADRSKGPRKTRLGGPYDFMRRVLATDKGADLYSQRQWMVEPVFADIKQNRRAGRFKRRAGRRSVPMATDRRHAQPAEAPSTHPGDRRGQIGRGLSHTRFRGTASLAVGLCARRRAVVRRDQEERPRRSKISAGQRWVNTTYENSRKCASALRARNR